MWLCVFHFAIKNYHEVGDFKNTSLLFLSSVGQKGSPAVPAELRLLLWGRLISSSFPPSRGYLHSLVCGPFLHLQSQQKQAKSFSCWCLSSHEWFSAFKDPCNRIRPIWTIQDNLPISRSLTLIISAKSSLSCRITYSQVVEIRMGYLRGPLFYLSLYMMLI